MKKFKFQLFGSLSLVFSAVMIFLVVSSYFSFKAESVSLNQELLIEKNNLIDTAVRNTVAMYKKNLQSIKMVSIDKQGELLSTTVRKSMMVFIYIIGMEIFIMKKVFNFH